MPWFMTVFGRDTLITCLQTLIFGPELARTALRALARAAGDRGRSVARRRAGQDRPRGAPRQGGRELVRALLRHRRRDAALPRPALGGLALDRRRRARARAARAGAARRSRWIDEYGDRDGDGFVEYERRTRRGLENQSWKDSWDSQRFHDGTLARAPIAPCEVQGYVYDAKLRMAELAREVWRDRELAERLEREAAELRARFDEAFWVEERGGFYALALDGEKRPVDSLCSNIGHLLWSGIVPRGARRRGRRPADGRRRSGRAGACARCPPATSAYNPLSYHNGTVWPHDNSLDRLGAGAPRALAARRSASCARCSTRRATSTTSCRRCSPGCRRAETPFPIAYPTAARPQAWAAGTPVLLLQLLLGLQPDRRGNRSTRSPRPSCRPGRRSTPARRRARVRPTWDVRLEDGASPWRRR